VDAHDLVTGVDGARRGHGGVDSAGQGGQDAHGGLLHSYGYGRGRLPQVDREGATGRTQGTSWRPA